MGKILKLHLVTIGATLGFSLIVLGNNSEGPRDIQSTDLANFKLGLNAAEVESVISSKHDIKTRLNRVDKTTHLIKRIYLTFTDGRAFEIIFAGADTKSIVNEIHLTYQDGSYSKGLLSEMKKRFGKPTQEKVIANEDVTILAWNGMRGTGDSINPLPGAKATLSIEDNQKARQLSVNLSSSK